MKRIIKGALGRTLIFLAEAVPVTRKSLRSMGVRLTQGLFGDRTVTVRMPSGPPLRLTHVDDSYLAFQLFWRGGEYYEPVTRALLETMIRPQDTFLDIGAHAGFYAVRVGASVKGVKVIAFEPNSKNFRLLKTNVAANGLSNIVCEPLAISDRDGAATLYLAESDMSASLVKNFQPEDTKQVGSVEVQTTSLDSYLAKIALQGKLIIKVDIEGHELAFFRGADDTLIRDRPDIVLEVLNELEPDVVGHLKLLGYHFYAITDAGLIELDAPRLFKRMPFLFLNELLSTRPKKELTEIFQRVSKSIQGIDMSGTSKFIPEEERPRWWGTATCERAQIITPPRASRHSSESLTT